MTIRRMELQHAPYCPVNTGGWQDCRCTPVMVEPRSPKEMNRHQRRAMLKGQDRERPQDRHE